MFPRALAPFSYPRGFQTRRANSSGDISRHKDRVFISQVFACEDLGFEEVDEEIYQVYFRDIELGEQRAGAAVQARSRSAVSLDERKKQAMDDGRGL